MDKTGIIVVSLCVVLLGIWFYESTKMAQQTQQAQLQAQRDAATNTVVTAQGQPAPTNGNAVPAATATSATVFFDTNTPEQTFVLTNQQKSARYTFTSRGGGLKLIELLNYPRNDFGALDEKENDERCGGLVEHPRRPCRCWRCWATPAWSATVYFTLTKTDDGVRAEKLLPDGLRLVKEFHLGSNYLVNASVRLENTSDKPLALPAQELVVGTATPMDVDDNSFAMYEGAMWFDGAEFARPARCRGFRARASVVFAARRGRNIVAGANDVVWAAAHNQFFAVLAMPKQPAEQIVARPVMLPAFPNVEPLPDTPLPRGIQAALVYPAQTLDDEFRGGAANCFVRRAEGIPDAGEHRRAVSKSRGQRHGLRRVFGLLREAAVAGDELAARRDAAGLRLDRLF